MPTRQRLMLTALAGVLVLVATGAADFLFSSFWIRHALLTSLVSSLVVLAVTVAVVNEVFAGRDRKRWTLLAQTVLLALTQSARGTWTALVEVLALSDVDSGSSEALEVAAAAARDTPRLSEAVYAALADDGRRDLLRAVFVGLRDHSRRVIADWAPVMVGARPYAEVLDRHVELTARLDWLASVLTHARPPEDQSQRDRVLVRSTVAAEHADALGEDRALHHQIVAVVTLALELDDSSHRFAYSLVPLSWWEQRTVGLAGDGLMPGAPAAAGTAARRAARSRSGSPGGE